MDKILLTSLTTISLVACGGVDSNSTPPPDTSFSAQLSDNIKGSVAEPKLSVSEATEGDSLSINSMSKGKVSADSYITFNFTAKESKSILAVFSSNVKDSYIEIDNITSSEQYNSTGDGLDSATFFNSSQSSQYTIKIHSPREKDTTFSLKLVTANRETLNLTKHEYAAYTQEAINNSCFGFPSGSGPSYNYDDGNLSNAVISIYNWKDGYFRPYGKSEKYNFTSMNGSSIEVNIFKTNTSPENGDTAFIYKNKFTLTTNPNTGAITGLGNCSSSYTSNVILGALENEYRFIRDTESRAEIPSSRPSPNTFGSIVRTPIFCLPVNQCSDKTEFSGQIIL